MYVSHDDHVVAHTSDKKGQISDSGCLSMQNLRGLHTGYMKMACSTVEVT